MKTLKEIRTLGEDAIKLRLAEIRKEIMKLNAQVAIGTVPKNSGAIRKGKRTIARILTILNERRIKAKA